ncbi:MAG: VOC family protein [Actinobacteria bacterium]|nr:VOC family protein [Actinomycetota bacterium]
MRIELAKDSIDLGIVTNDAAPLLEFYCDTLGLEPLREVTMPGGTLHFLRCGASTVKIMQVSRPVPAAADGRITATTGYRYWTISVADVAAAVERCTAAGRAVPMPPTELWPGTTAAIVEDPDGNWVEFLESR